MQLLKLVKDKFITTNIEDQVDQVVAMIFRVTPSQEIQLLYLQRAFSQRDYYSGDLCFPGGHRETGESCYQAAIRQVNQQTALILNQNNYLGALNYKLRTTIGLSKVRLSKERMQLFMGVLMFHIEYDKSQYIKLQLNEVRSFKWINIKATFFFGKKQNFTRWTPNVVFLPERVYTTYFPAYNIGMERALWGLTFNVTMIFMNAVYSIAKQNPQIKFEIDEPIFREITQYLADLQIVGDQDTVQKIKKHYFEERVWLIKPKL